MDRSKSLGTGSFVEREWTVSGVRRTALVRIPKDGTAPKPVVFCWHGHGGRVEQAANQWGYDKVDRTSILVFPQGLPTVSPLVDPRGRMPGWQIAVGAEGDRDVRLFDAILSDLGREHPIDVGRIYSMGHSNGGAFSYVLWQARPNALAAIGVVAGGLRAEGRTLLPLPVIHVAGEQDPLVKFSWQQRTFDEVRRVNGCSATGRLWARAGEIEATIFSSSKGAPMVTAIHGGGHGYVRGSSDLIARFFGENPRRAR